MQTPTVAIIGAGLAGLTAAKKLIASECDVTIFDKSRGVGGRIATRRADAGLVFHHGLAYLRGASIEFTEQLKQWCEQGVLRQWTGQIVRLPLNGKPIPVQTAFTRYVSYPNATSLPKYLSAGLNLKLGVSIHRLERVGTTWRLIDADQNLHGTFDQLVIAVPPQQTTTLLGADHPACRQIASVQMKPVWALMVGLEKPSGLTFDAARPEGSPLVWMMRTISRSEDTNTECWSFHVDTEWSRHNLERTPDEIIALLRPEIERVLGTSNLLHVAAHRWRYALAGDPLGVANVRMDAEQLTIIGDWCLGDRAEHAWLSGRSV